MPIRIERTAYTFARERPLLTERGYQLIDPAIPFRDRGKIRFATFVATLEEAAALVRQGFALRMARPGSSRGGYIAPQNLKITED